MADQGAGQQRPAGWKKDPSGRHFGRYWNGSQWTEHVISAEKTQGVDPLPARSEPTIFPEGAVPAPTVPTAPVQPDQPTMQWRGPPPTAPGWTPGTKRLRGPAPVRPPENDPRGRGTNQVVAAVRGWPRWAKWTAGAAVGVVLIAAAASGGEDEDRPVPLVGNVATTLTLPLASTVPAPPVTQATTTEATAPATTQAPAPTAATVPATTAATAPVTTAARPVQQGVTPGAFCSPGGASGVTNTGVSMSCTTSATDSRNRWRSA